LPWAAPGSSSATVKTACLDQFRQRIGPHRLGEARIILRRREQEALGFEHRNRRRLRDRLLQDDRRKAICDCTAAVPPSSTMMALALAFCSGIAPGASPPRHLRPRHCCPRLSHSSKFTVEADPYSLMIVDPFNEPSAPNTAGGPERCMSLHPSRIP
jgi:hypothetical protein